MRGSRERSDRGAFPSDEATKRNPHLRHILSHNAEKSIRPFKAAFKSVDPTGTPVIQETTTHKEITMKKRYQLTLTVDNVNAFKAALKKANFPPSVLSSAVDDFLRDMAKTVDKCATKGSFTFIDFFTTLGEQVQDLVQEEINHAEKHKEKTTARKGN